MIRKLVIGTLAVSFTCIAITASMLGASTKADQRDEKGSKTAAARGVPLYFEENQGQTDGQVRFTARGGGYTAFLTDQEAVLVYRNGKPGQKSVRDAVVRMSLSGSRKSGILRAGEPLPGIVNYLTGNDPSKWHTRIPTYDEVDSDEVYPGVGLTYRPNGQQLEFDFRVAPGASPDPIRMIYSGASRMRLNAAGDLVLDTDAGPVNVLKPVAYQDFDGKRVPVTASYSLLRGGEVGLHLGIYDRGHALVIDPIMGMIPPPPPSLGPSVWYSTYLGSGSGDTFSSIAVDAAGEAFITGSTYNANYPTGALPGFSPYQAIFNINYFNNDSPAGFVTALNANGTGIIYSTYIAGNSSTSSVGVALNAIAVDSTGFAFVGGQTDDSTFPIVKAFQSTIPGSRTIYGDAVGVVLELSQHGDSLIYSSFLGGGDYDSISGIAVDSSDNAYVTGVNTVQGSSNTSSGFPVTGGAIWGHFTQQNIGAGFVNSFASKISLPTSGNATLTYSTLIGSSGSNTPFVYGHSIAVDSSGDAYVTGSANCNIGDHGGTITTNLNMTHVTRAQSEYVNNVWVLELNPAATAAVYIAYLGGSAPGAMFSPNTSVAGISVDSTGKAYVAGLTEANDFQTTLGAYQTTKSLAGVTNSGTEQSDAFVTIIAAAGASFSYSTYLNGTTVSPTAITDEYFGSPAIGGIALGTGGQFTVAGYAATTNFPQSGSPAGTPLLTSFPGCPGACADDVAFITKFTTSGLVYSTFLGAGNENGVNGVASNGTDVYLLVSELGNGLTSGGAYDADNSSGVKELVLRISDAVAIPTTASVDAQTANFSSSSQTVSLTSTINAASTVNGGVVTYSLKNAGSVAVGSPVTSGIVAAGLAPITSFTLPASTPIGTYTITANYKGAEDFLSSSATGNLVVSSAAPATSTAVASSLNPSVFGQSVTFTATVASASAAPTGTVQFEVDGVNLGGTVTLVAVNGTSSAATSPATAAISAAGSPHTVLANFVNAGGTFANSNNTLATGQTVTLATQATVTVTGMPGTAQIYGATFTVGSSGGSGTGAVTFTATGSCSVTGTTVTVTSGSGICSVTATRATDGNYSSATSATATVSAALATQSAVTVTGMPGTAQIYGATFTVGDTGGSGTGAVTFGATGSCTVTGTTVTITSGLGTCSVTATKATDGNYASTTSTAATVSAALATQTAVTVTGVPGTAQIYGATITVASTGGSGTGAVTFIATGSCSVSGTTVTVTSGSGICSVTATKATDGNYSSKASAAATVSAALATQTALTVTGTPGTAQIYGATFTVASTGGSGTGAVTFSATGSCSVSGTTVTITSGSGICSVTATKASDGNYASVVSTAATVSAALATQAVVTVTGMPGTAQAYGASFTLGSTGGSGTGTVTFAATGSCSVSGATVTMTSGTGICSVTATKASDGNYASATSTAVTASAALATQATVTVTGMPGTAQIYGATFTVGDIGGSGTGAVTFIATGSCSVSGTTVTMTSGTGICSVTATKSTDGNYSGTTSAAATVNAALATQAAVTVTGIPGTAQIYGATFTVGGTGGSGTGAITFAATGSCSVSGTTVTMTSGTGTCSVTATKAADGNYAEATSSAATVGAFLATQAAVTVTGVPGTAQIYGATFTVGDTGGSGTGAVTFSTTGSCSVSGTTVTMTSGSGICSVTATRATDGNYTSSTSTAATVNAALATQAAVAVTGMPGTAQIYGATFTIGSSGGSGTGAVTFIATGSCSVSGTTVTITSGSGVCSVTATKAADGNYLIASSPAAMVSAALASQAAMTVTGVPGTAQLYGATFTVGDTGGSGTGAVTFSATGSCSVAGTTVTMTSGTGICSITATKATDGNYSSDTSTAGTVSAAPATQATLTVTGMPISAQDYGATFTLGSSGGSGTGAVTFTATGSCSVSGTTVTMTSGAGTCSVTATKATDGNFSSATSAAATVAANKASATVSVWPSASSITFGQTLASSILSGGTASVGGVFAFTAPGTAPAAGTASQGVTFTPTDTIDYSAATGTTSVTVNKAAPVVSAWPAASSIVYGQTLASSALTGGAASVSGAFAWTISATTPGAGTPMESVTFTPADASDYNTATGSVSVTVSKATATVTLGSLAQTYTGSPLSVTATTNPAGLTVMFTYTGVGGTAYGPSATAPTEVGSYSVAGTISNANYTGAGNGTLVISKASATVTLGSLAQTYTGLPLAATATTDPAGLTVTFAYAGIGGTTYGPSSTAPIGIGSYSVVGIVSSASYSGSGSGTLAISKATATVLLGGLTRSYTGLPVAATATTTPSGLTVSFTYTGTSGTTYGPSSNAPTSGGSYSVVATIVSLDYSGSATGTLVIGQLESTVRLTSSANPTLAQNAITFTARVSSGTGTPTGTIRFMDGTIVLGQGTLSGGVATLTTSSFSVGTYSIHAVYSGDANFVASTSNSLSLSVVGFNLSPGGGGGSGSQTVPPGGSATYNIAITPTAGSTFPVATILTVTGLPPGATASLGTPGWTQLTETSWSLPANTTLSNVSLTFKVPSQTKGAGNEAPQLRRIPPLLWGVLLLPFASRLRRAGKRMGRSISLMLLLAAGAVAMTGLSACGSGNGFFAQQQKTYTVTVTVTAGALSHSTNLSLTVQ